MKSCCYHSYEKIGDYILISDGLEYNSVEQENYLLNSEYLYLDNSNDPKSDHFPVWSVIKSKTPTETHLAIPPEISPVLNTEKKSSEIKLNIDILKILKEIKEEICKGGGSSLGGQSESGIPDVNFNLLNLSKLISDGRQNFFGLINEANFCYLNSALQMLYSITDFVNFVVKEDFGELQKPSNINDENFNNDKTKLATLKILFSDLINVNTTQKIQNYQDYFAYVINKIPIGRTRTTTG